MSINSGATTHAFTKENTGINNDMVHINLPFSNITKTPNGVKVMYPDGNTAQATHEAVLNLPILPIAARKVHLFESLASGALISLGKLCDSGCTAYFNATKVYIFFKGKIIMQGARSNATNNLWKVNGTKVEQPTMSLNAVIDKKAQKYLKTIHRRQIKGFVKESKYSGCWSGAEPVAQT